MNYAAVLVSVLCYACFFAGLALVFWNSFSALHGWVTLRRRLSQSRNNRGEFKPVMLLSRLVFLSTGKEGKGKITFAFELIFFFLTLFVAAGYFSLFISLIIALAAASVPVVSLVSKIQTTRNRSSREGPGFVSELYRQYRICDRNIYSAMEALSRDNQDFPVCSKQLYMLLLRIRNSGSRTAVSNACSDFSYALGSMWGKSVAGCILAAASGTDISEALLDIMEQLKNAKEQQEERRRLNSEAVRMTVFLVPLMYLGTMLVAVKSLGLSVSRLFRNQFLTPAGFLLFFISAFLFFANIIVLSFVSGDRTDI